jgi:hypothetical protein
VTFDYFNWENFSNYLPTMAAAPVTEGHSDESIETIHRVSTDSMAEESCITIQDLSKFADDLMKSAVLMKKFVDPSYIEKMKAEKDKLAKKESAKVMVSTLLYKFLVVLKPYAPDKSRKDAIDKCCEILEKNVTDRETTMDAFELHIPCTDPYMFLHVIKPIMYKYTKDIDGEISSPLDAIFRELKSAKSFVFSPEAELTAEQEDIPFETLMPRLRIPDAAKCKSRNQLRALPDDDPIMIALAYPIPMEIPAAGDKFGMIMYLHVFGTIIDSAFYMASLMMKSKFVTYT